MSVFLSVSAPYDAEIESLLSLSYGVVEAIELRDLDKIIPFEIAVCGIPFHMRHACARAKAHPGGSRCREGEDAEQVVLVVLVHELSSARHLQLAPSDVVI